METFYTKVHSVWKSNKKSHSSHYCERSELIFLVQKLAIIFKICRHFSAIFKHFDLRCNTISFFSTFLVLFSVFIDTPISCTKEVAPGLLLTLTADTFKYPINCRKAVQSQVKCSLIHHL